MLSNKIKMLQKRRSKNRKMDEDGGGDMSGNQPGSKTLFTLLPVRNVSEILFDVITIKNELLLESILCCLHLFVHGAPDVTKCRLVFGIETITDISYSLLGLRNWRLLSLALNILTTIIASNEHLITSSHITFFYRSIQLTEKAFAVQNPTVLLAICKFFTEFLRNKNLPWSLPLEQIHNNMSLCIVALSTFLSPSKISEQTPLENSKPLPIEMEILICSLDILSSCISLCKHYNLNPVSVESRFTCPKAHGVNESASSSNEKSTEPLFLLCFSSVDKYFIPCCLKLKQTGIGRTAWYHLVKVLVLIFEENQDSILIYQLCKKLISAGIFKYLFDLKGSKSCFNECSAEQVKNLCNQCVKGLLQISLKKESNPEMYQNALENGIVSLNDSLEECSSVLSQKSNRNVASTEFCASSSQIAYLCLCYVSYRNEAFVVNIKILIPHLVYFVTCNSDLLSSCTVLLKHIIFLMAVCTYECASRKLKFLTGLMEANVIVWDILQKLKSPLQVYIHHKYILWWCFRNKACNPFSSCMLMKWLEYCVNEKYSVRHYAMKTVIYLLSESHIAQQTFVCLFGLASSSSNETLVTFLKEAYELEAFSDISKKNFQDLIILMIHHLHTFLVNIYVMKNESDKSIDKILCQGLDCLLWCHRQVDDITIDAKILFYVSKYCFLATCKEIETLTACIKFLTFTVNHHKHFDKAWHVMTGDINFPSFFYKCFASHMQLEVEALCLLVSLLSCQVKYSLKCNTHVQIPPNLILKWLNSSKTQNLAYQILNLLIKYEFQDDLFLSTPLDCGTVSLEHQQYVYYRLFSLYLVNAIVSENPIFQDAADGYLKFLNVIEKTNKYLEEHIMFQPWIKILLESRLEKLDSVTWNLFEKLLSSNKINSSLIGVIHQFANKVQNINPLTDEQRQCINKLCTGTYACCLSEETRDALIELSTDRIEVNNRVKDLVTQVQNLVTDYLSYEP